MSHNPPAEVRLGRALRAARHARGLTLIEVAAAAGLSQPFLSQLELGRARPSMRSLHRIALALGTTQQALLAGVSGPVAGGRAEGAELVDVGADGGGGGARLLLHEPAGVDLTEFVGLPREFQEYFAHPRAEMIYVARGTIEVDVDRTLSTLHARDTLTYPGGAEHRYRQVGEETCVLLVIHRGC